MNRHNALAFDEADMRRRFYRRRFRRLLALPDNDCPSPACPFRAAGVFAHVPTLRRGRRPTRILSLRCDRDPRAARSRARSPIARRRAAWRSCPAHRGRSRPLNRLRPGHAQRARRRVPAERKRPARASDASDACVRRRRRRTRRRQRTPRRLRLHQKPQRRRSESHSPNARRAWRRKRARCPAISRRWSPDRRPCRPFPS